MALLADDAKDRAEQLIILTDRLSQLVTKETDLIRARLPPLDGEEGEEKSRLANAYRLELTRIRQEPGLLTDAPAPLLEQLKKKTAALHEQLDAHELEIGAVKLVAEGLVHAMASEIARQRGAARGYSAAGSFEGPAGPSPVALDRKA